jgi:hypothetical protein
MSESRKLECMKDIVELARKVGDVRMKQCALHDGSTHTTFACRIPRDTYPDVLADVSNQGELRMLKRTGDVYLGQTISKTHSVAIVIWPGG